MSIVYKAASKYKFRNQVKLGSETKGNVYFVWTVEYYKIYKFNMQSNSENIRCNSATKTKTKNKIQQTKYNKSKKKINNKNNSM